MRDIPTWHRQCDDSAGNIKPNVACGTVPFTHCPRNVRPGPPAWVARFNVCFTTRARFILSP
eukprot:988590-Pyramimonas_sp.AAC.1